MSPHPGVVLDSAIDTTIPVGTRVVLVEDHRSAGMRDIVKAGMRGVIDCPFCRMNEESNCFGGYTIKFDDGHVWLVNASAVRRESEVDAPKVEAPQVITPYPSEAIPSESVPAVLSDDFRDRLIIECAGRLFAQEWTADSRFFDGARRVCDFADAVVAERAKGDRLASLRESLRDVFEVVPAGQPVTRMCHDDSLVAAPGVTLRKSEGESHSERGGR